MLLLEASVLHDRAVARSEIPGGLVVMGGDNVSPLVKIGLADLPNIGGAKAPQPPPCDGPENSGTLPFKMFGMGQKVLSRLT